MKTIAFLFLASILSVAVMAQPPKGPVTPGTTFGEITTTGNAVPIAQLPQLVSDKETVVKVTGVVTEVCPKKGCWISLALPGDEKVFVKMKDYAFFVPVELKGKTVVIDATAQRITTSVDELRHYAEDAKKSKEEIEAITESKEEIRLVAKGIRVQ